MSTSCQPRSSEESQVHMSFLINGVPRHSSVVSSSASSVVNWKPWTPWGCTKSKSNHEWHDLEIGLSKQVVEHKTAPAQTRDRRTKMLRLRAEPRRRIHLLCNEDILLILTNSYFFSLVIINDLKFPVDYLALDENHKILLLSVSTPLALSMSHNPDVIPIPHR